ncbi:hypothetical protein [Leptospira saintgironsiae]|uniref:hypothetical protein n=1 Tax=Leptospira saintgironsiae TaxID=2023183 RepID=UPI000F6434F2|nr:hypothetical protein [Leptospira saintgironsiae]
MRSKNKWNLISLDKFTLLAEPSTILIKRVFDSESLSITNTEVPTNIMSKMEKPKKSLARIVKFFKSTLITLA